MIHVLLMLVGNGEAWFDDVEAVVVGDVPAVAPGLFVVHGEFKVATTSDADVTALIPMPLNGSGQAPLSYELACVPPERLKSVHMREDGAGNRVAAARIAAAPEGAPARLAWRSIVLAIPSGFEDVPKAAPIPGTWPEEARPWLAPTRSVQSGDEEIRRIADEIRRESDDVPTIIEAALVRAKRILEAPISGVVTLNAGGALNGIGTGVGRASFIAAILRASGVPARLVAGYPARGAPLRKTYVVEAYVPAQGWLSINPDTASTRRNEHEQIDVCIVTPAQEDADFGGEAIADRRPPYSVVDATEGSGGFVMIGAAAPGELAGEGGVRALRNFPVDAPRGEWEALLQASSARWNVLMKREPAVVKDGALSLGFSVKDVAWITMERLRKALSEEAERR